MTKHSDDQLTLPASLIHIEDKEKQMKQKLKNNYDGKIIIASDLNVDEKKDSSDTKKREGKFCVVFAFEPSS